LKFEGRPYGEFVPGGNAQGPGTFDDILAKMKEYIEGPSTKKAKTSKQSNRK